MGDVSDSHLVSVHDARKVSFLLALLMTPWVYSCRRYFDRTGLYDVQAEGYLVCTDGSAYVYVYANSNTDEPNKIMH